MKSRRASRSITLVLITSSVFLASCEDRTYYPSAAQNNGDPNNPAVAGTDPSTMPVEPGGNNSNGSTASGNGGSAYHYTGTNHTYTPIYHGSSSSRSPFSIGSSLFSSGSSFSHSSSFHSSGSVATVHGGFGSTSFSHASFGG